MTSWPPDPEPLDFPASDGATIAVHHYPAPESPAPATTMFLPYRKESYEFRLVASAVASHGYHVLVADVRGFGGSPGPYRGLLSSREVDDGVELVEWVAAQDFCDGNVGMIGGSYGGANQLLIAARRPDALRCITPLVPPVDTYRDWTHRGGIPSHVSWGANTYLRAQRERTTRDGLIEYYDRLLAHPFDDEGHRSRSPEYVLGDIEVPTLCVGGWDDYFLRSTVRAFRGVRGPKRLVIGPWGHAGLDLSAGREVFDWLDHWLKGEGEDPSGRSAVSLYCEGADEWMGFPSWPASGDPDWRRWFPIGGRTRVDVLPHIGVIPPAQNPRPGLLDDPTNSGMGKWGEAWTVDGDPVGTEILLIGPLTLQLDLSVVDAEDVDVHARISVVGDAGVARHLSEGRLRASHRALDPERSEFSGEDCILPWHPHDHAEPLAAEEPIRMVLEMAPVCTSLGASDRLRLGLTITRADESAAPTEAVLLPATRVMLPAAGQTRD